MDTRDEEVQHTLRDARRAAWLIWGGLTASLPAYLAVAVFVRPSSGEPPVEGMPVTLLHYVGLALAGLLVLAGPWTRSAMLAANPLEDSGRGPGTPHSDITAAKLVGQRLLTAHVIGMALAESAAVIGLGLFLLHPGLERLAPFLLLSAVGFALSMPRRGTWDRVAERMLRSARRR